MFIGARSVVEPENEPEIRVVIGFESEICTLWELLGELVMALCLWRVAHPSRIEKYLGGF
jgi:hypothetical protein